MTKNEGQALCSLFATASGDKWKRIGIGKRAGVLVPLFYIHSKESIGIGDLGDLKPLVDWCAVTGTTILQLLPMNEVGPTFCPYDSISSFALEPAYISLRSVEASGTKAIEHNIAAIKKAFPAGKGHVNYKVKTEKVRILWETYLDHGSGVRTGEFKKFLEENAYWIDDFALYKVLKEHHGGRPWYDWEEPYRDRVSAKLKGFRKEHEKEVLFEIWVQWQLYKQFTDVKRYAGSKKVLIKGDLPILVSRDSADVWAHPDFFNLGYAAGAPPDMYCAKGQRWGMPTQDWERTSEKDYRYLREKLAFAGNFYDILRVDHVVGLFRIWSIPNDDPSENQGLNGSFDPADEGVWAGHGRELLKVILDTTDMLLCGEDLGTIPPACPEALNDLGIPGNDVQRWVKDWNEKHDFLDPEDYRAIAVSMLSTHDTTNWAAWWEDEAGTVDEALFVRICAEKGIDFDAIKGHLFDPERSRHRRLRWLDAVESVDVLVSILDRGKDTMWDIINLYENSFAEKEKLWKHLKMKGRMREKADPEIVRAVLKMTMKSRSVFSIQLLSDLLTMAGKIKGDFYRHRINTPGTVSEENWSLTSPVPLEELSDHDFCKDIKGIITDAGRLSKT